MKKITKESIQSKRSIENINAYKGGRAKLNNNKRVIKLSSNENPYGASPKSIELLETKNINNDLHRYPEIDGSSLRQAISKYHSIDSDRIILGSGSDEILLFAALAFCQDGDEILHANHGFEMYSIVSKIVGAVPKKIIEDSNFNIKIDSLLDQISDATKVIYIASPNNPTGTYLTRDQILDLMYKIPKNIIVVS